MDFEMPQGPKGSPNIISTHTRPRDPWTVRNPVYELEKRVEGEKKQGGAQRTPCANTTEHSEEKVISACATRERLGVFI
jgi:hypothetical protein